MNKPKVIAFYLPQYHPTPDNDKWWGKGFTEWTNVGKAKPLFPGHYQPKVPADLGYYDLRLPEVREAQAELAREAGIYGFCYYHYWFGNGKEELELPFNEVLRLGKPDFPFMLCWANESWHKKFWDKDGNGNSKKVLIEQLYPGTKDHIDHFYRLLPAFKDPRYIKIDGKLAFMIYMPDDFPNVRNFFELWNNLAKKEGLNGFFFICQIRHNINTAKIEEQFNNGYDGVNTMRLFDAIKLKKNLSKRFMEKLCKVLFNSPIKQTYNSISNHFISKEDYREGVYATIIPNWDHTPRSGRNGVVVTDATPSNFKAHVKNAMSYAKESNKDILFLKSWNEWGEGNYMEPDLLNGKGYIEAMCEAMMNM